LAGWVTHFQRRLAAVDLAKYHDLAVLRTAKRYDVISEHFDRLRSICRKGVAFVDHCRYEVIAARY
jgi:hypothetical protein